MENQFSRLVDALSGSVWMALPDGHIDFLDQDLPELLERWRSILASGEPGEMEARLRRFDGEYRYEPCLQYLGHYSSSPWVPTEIV